MAEPISTSTTTTAIFGISVVVFGPLVGQWATIIFAALAGGMWSVGRSSTGTRIQAAILLLKIVSAAVILSGGAAALIEAKWGVPAKQVLAPVAFLIGFVGDHWQDVIQAVIDRVSSIIRGNDSNKP